MTARSGTRWGPVLAASGWLLIGVGVLCNEWLLARFSQDGVLRSDTKWLIRGFELIALAAGMLLLVARRSPLLRKVVCGALMGLVVLASVEVLGIFLNGAKQARLEVVHSRNPYLTDELLGKKPQPDCEIHTTWTRDGVQSYDITYRFDQHSRRKTPVEAPEERGEFALFFGGSFTLGEGVEDDESLPSCVAQLAPDLQPYNYGFSGYGTQQMLATLEGRELHSEVPETSGMLVYTFLDDHVDRTVGTFRVCTRYAYGMHYPYYVLEGDRVVRRQDFASGRPALSALYRLLARSQMLEYINLDFPGISESDVRTTAAVVEAARDRFQEVFESDAFYVLFFPAYSVRYVDDIKPRLESAGITCLDYSDLFTLEQPEHWIQGAWHPSALAYRTVAERLVDDLLLARPVRER